jgi:hypothetical protein
LVGDRPIARIPTDGTLVCFGILEIIFFFSEISLDGDLDP